MCTIHALLQSSASHSDSDDGDDNASHLDSVSSSESERETYSAVYCQYSCLPTRDLLYEKMVAQGHCGDDEEDIVSKVATMILVNEVCLSTFYSVCA